MVDSLKRKTINDIYEEYIRNCKTKPTEFGTFLRIYSSINHHRTYIRPQIKWWHDLRKDYPEEIW